jgi:hypothetical protein
MTTAMTMVRTITITTSTIEAHAHYDVTRSLADQYLVMERDGIKALLFS